MTHAALDAQPEQRAVEHLRDLLLAVGALPEDPERLLRRLQNDSQQILNSLELNDARIVRSWIRWQVMPRLRRHLDGPLDLRTMIGNAKSTLNQVVAFVSAIEAQHRTLVTCQRVDIDTWFKSRKAGHHRARPFLVWARRTKHLPSTLTLPPSYQSHGEARSDPEERWTIARRLVQDATLDVVDRMAGALVVLYARSGSVRSPATTSRATARP